MAAIYQWEVAGIVYTLYTTTLYPIEAVEALVFTIDLDSGSMVEIATDEIALGMSLIAATLISILLEVPEQEDKIDLGISLIAATLESKLITTYHPDQGLIMTIDLDDANCSMTNV